MSNLPPPAPNPSSLTEGVTMELRRLLARAPSQQNLNAALRHLAKWRAHLVENTLVAKSGDRVLSGPFKDMSYGLRASEGARSARLLGCYEAGLAPVIEQIIATAYPLVIDVGCAEGYYAVGLARRMPQTRVLARDASDKAQALCADLAAQNDVAAQIAIGGLMQHADFDICKAQPSVVICDIEGAEGDLLDPLRAPGLRHADILVEVHEGMQAGLTAVLQSRFAQSHNIQHIGRVTESAALPDWMETLSDMDRLLALWEWRSGPTPWLWMTRK